MNLLVDIYGVHKAFVFGQSQRSDYPFSKFIDDVKKADRRHLGASNYPSLIAKNKSRFELSFYPLYLVNDSVFDVMACHFAVSSVVNEMKKEWKGTGELQIWSVVVPVSACSRYDADIVHKSSIMNLDRFLKEASSDKIHFSRIIKSGFDSLPEMMSITRDLTHRCLSELDDQSAIVIVFDRQQFGSNTQSVTVFECPDLSELVPLKLNYYISFDFHISGQQTAGSNIGDVRCWLTFGEGQRLRWYPEYAVWIIPHLFVRSTTMTPFKVIQKLYAEEYKHGWRVQLDDKVFNKYYHIITGFEHISNNYNREEVKEKLSVQKSLRDEVEENLNYRISVALRQYFEYQAYDSEGISNDLLTDKKHFDAENSNIAALMTPKSVNLRTLKFLILRFENVECKEGDILHIDDCKFIDSVVRYLQKFEDCNHEVDACTVYQFDLEPIISGFDHMIKVHKFFAEEQRKVHIRKYISERVQCRHGEECPVLDRHSNRARERESIEEKREEPLNEVDALCGITADILNSIHSYALHEQDHLYRLLSRRNQKFQHRFTTVADGVESKTNDEHQPLPNAENRPIGLNFGVNVLQWLSFGCEPYFDSLKPEIINNPDSTIDEQLFTHFLMVCIEKIKGTKYTEQEMMCLKLYSDTTELQALLRRAHWTGISLKVRKTYYQWALGIYRTHLYHAKPVPTAFGSTNQPCRLFHGLNTLFLVSHELPVYNGPFSTTISKNVARTFCKDQGLLFVIQPSYVNPLRFCLGISMTWISSFKHEQEVMLYNEYLPIQKSQTFDDDPDILINHLLWSLKSRETPINKISSFYNQLGVRFNGEWIPSIMKRALLFEPTKCGDMRVIDRLSRELRLTFFMVLLAVRESCTIDANNDLFLRLSDDFKDTDLTQLTFTIDFGTVLGAELPQFVLPDSNQMTIPHEAFTARSSDSWKFIFGLDTWTFNLYCKSTDDSYPFIQIHSLLLPLYIFRWRVPLEITESIVAPNINDNGRIRDFCVRSFSSISNSAQVTGAVNMYLISNGDFCNNGTITCNGTDHSIFIVCDTFTNTPEGVVQCIDDGNSTDGEVHIFCRDFNNNGTVIPNPRVTTLLLNEGMIPSETLPEIVDLPVSIVDFLMHILRTERSLIDASWVYNNFGFRVEPTWYQHIVDHPLLFQLSNKESDDANYRIIDRLAYEMKLKFFQFFDQIHGKLHLEEGTSIRLTELPNDKMKDTDLQVSKWEMFLEDDEEIYCLGVVRERKFGRRLGKEHIMILTSRGSVIFVKLMQMELAKHKVVSANEFVSAEADQKDEMELELNLIQNKKAINKQYKCQNVTAVQWKAAFVAVSESISNDTNDHVFEFEHRPLDLNLLSEYKLSAGNHSKQPIGDVSKFEIPVDFEEMAPIHVYAHSVDQSFSPIRIKSVMKKRFISKEDRPFRIRHSIQIPPRDRQQNFGGYLEVKSLSDIVVEKDIVIRGSRGTVKFFASRDVQNKGTLNCSGGIIHISAERFINDGVLECGLNRGLNGRIHIICKVFQNDGKIFPTPFVVYVPKGTVQLTQQPPIEFAAVLRNKRSLKLFAEHLAREYVLS